MWSYGIVVGLYSFNMYRKKNSGEKEKEKERTAKPDEKSIFCGSNIDHGHDMQ